MVDLYGVQVREWHKPIDYKYVLEFYIGIFISNVEGGGEIYAKHPGGGQ